MANVNNDRFGGRFLIQDSNHMSDIPDSGGRFAIQDHDHLAGVSQQQVNAGEADVSDRQQGGEDQGKKSKKRTGRQYM